MSPAPNMTTETSKQRFERIKSEVMTLTPKQRSELSQLLGASTTPKEVETSTPVLDVYTGVTAALQDLGLQPPPYPILLKRMGTSLPRVLAGVEAFMGKQLPTSASRTDRVAAYAWLARLVRDVMHTRQIPVSVSTVFQQLEQAPLHVDDQFPGYAQAGMLQMVVLRQIRGTGSPVL